MWSSRSTYLLPHPSPRQPGEEKQEVSEQLTLRKVPSVYVSPGGRHSDLVSVFHFSIFVFNLLIFTSTFWKNGKVKNKKEITMGTPWASVVYITCLNIFFYSFLLFCSEILLTTAYLISRLVCCINFHGCLHFGSYFWKHLRHFC